MKKAVIFSSLTAAAAIAAASPASATTCPAIGADTDCGFLITINADGSITAGSTGQPPYDLGSGSEDTLVGVVNNSSVALTSLSLSGTDIFAFDSDGEATFPGGGNYGPTGYEGPNTSFTITDNNSGIVNFLNGGVPGGGGTAWFSLEENLADVTGGVTIGNGVPEPATWAMMLLGFGAMGVAFRRSRRQRHLATATA